MAQILGLRLVIATSRSGEAEMTEHTSGSPESLHPTIAQELQRLKSIVIATQSTKKGDARIEALD